MSIHSGGILLNQQNKKEIIRLAAVKVIAKNGFYTTTISQIAEEAKIAVGTIYNYFDQKEDILEYIFRVELEKRINYLQGVREKNISFWEKLKSFLEFHFSEFENNLDVAKILIREKVFPRSIGSGAFSEYMFKLPEEIEEIIIKAMKEGVIQDCNPELISGIIFGGIQGIVGKGIKNNNTELFKQAPQSIIELLKDGM